MKKKINILNVNSKRIKLHLSVGAQRGLRRGPGELQRGREQVQRPPEPGVRQVNYIFMFFIVLITNQKFYSEVSDSVI